MNKFGGDWTQRKIEMVVDYAKAYLTIMNKYPKFKILYFDGFAGSGGIEKETKASLEIIKGAALRVLGIEGKKSFDIYYFVELNPNNAESLRKVIKDAFPLKKKNAHVVCEDCNVKLVSLAEYLKDNPNYRALVFIDPYGMSINWSSIEALKGLGIDLWILVPTGIGVSRLLKRDGNISEGWLLKLEKFLGINRDAIHEAFYKKISMFNLFDNELNTIKIKQQNAINKIHEVYKERLLTVFKFVSDAFVLRNSRNAIMYHFIMATNNPAAFKIANDIVKPKYRI